MQNPSGQQRTPCPHHTGKYWTRRICLTGRSKPSSASSCKLRIRNWWSGENFSILFYFCKVVMKFHKLVPVCLSPEINELYLPSWNTISHPLPGFQTITYWYFVYIYMYIVVKKPAEQKPKAPVYIFQNCFSNHQAPADMLIQQTWTILTDLIPPVFFPLWGRSWANEQSWKRQESSMRGSAEAAAAVLLTCGGKGCSLVMFSSG